MLVGQPLQVAQSLQLRQEVGRQRSRIVGQRAGVVQVVLAGVVDRGEVHRVDLRLVVLRAHRSVPPAVEGALRAHRVLHGVGRSLAPVAVAQRVECVGAAGHHRPGRPGQRMRPSALLHRAACPHQQVQHLGVRVVLHPVGHRIQAYRAQRLLHARQQHLQARHLRRLAGPVGKRFLGRQQAHLARRGGRLHAGGHPGVDFGLAIAHEPERCLRRQAVVRPAQAGQRFGVVGPQDRAQPEVPVDLVE